MKKFFILLTAVLMTVCFQSCSDDKYTVWTETETYSDFQNHFNTTLEDGYYKRLEITNAQWEQIGHNLTSEGKHRWSEEEIKKWLIGNGFGNDEARKESSWLVMTNHAFLVTRDGNLVYMILK
jgi:hypothetical protein